MEEGDRCAKEKTKRGGCRKGDRRVQEGSGGGQNDRGQEGGRAGEWTDGSRTGVRAN